MKLKLTHRYLCYRIYKKGGGFIDVGSWNEI